MTITDPTSARRWIALHRGGRRDRGGRLWWRLVVLEVLELIGGARRHVDELWLERRRDSAGPERRRQATVTIRARRATATATSESRAVGGRTSAFALTRSPARTATDSRLAGGASGHVQRGS